MLLPLNSVVSKYTANREFPTQWNSTVNIIEDYVISLEKVNGGQGEYKGKPLSASQNKTRTLKNFLTRADIVLWFSKSFGLYIERIIVRESGTAIKHTLNMTSESPSELIEPQEPGQNTHYSKLSEEDKI